MSGLIYRWSVEDDEYVQRSKSCMSKNWFVSSDWEEFNPGFKRGEHIFSNSSYNRHFGVSKREYKVGWRNEIINSEDDKVRDVS